MTEITFQKAMDDRIQESTSKGSWNDWKPSDIELLNRLDYKHAKVIKEITLIAFNQGSEAELRKHLADLANYCQKFFQMHNSESNNE